MKLNKIFINNFRCFEEATVSLDQHMTLLVGKNGVGKTAVLDAAAVAVSTFLSGMEELAEIFKRKMPDTIFMNWKGLLMHSIRFLSS